MSPILERVQEFLTAHELNAHPHGDGEALVVPMTLTHCRCSVVFHHAPGADELVYYRMMRALSGNLTCAISLEKWFEKAGYAGFLEFGLAARPIFQQLFLNDASLLWPTMP